MSDSARSKRRCACASRTGLRSGGSPFLRGLHGYEPSTRLHSRSVCGTDSPPASLSMQQCSIGARWAAHTCHVVVRRRLASALIISSQSSVISNLISQQSSVITPAT